MQPLSEMPRLAAKRFDGSFPSEPEENFRPELFGEVAKIVWRKPDAVIADLTGKTDRQARSIIAGKAPVPAEVAAEMLRLIVRRPKKRRSR